MIIKQTRIMNVDFLKKMNGKKIRFAIPTSKEINSKIEKAGFSKSLNIGETILPCKIGPATRRNADGYNIIHRDKKKETCYRTVEWTWKQYSGRGETEERTDFKDVPYERWPRTLIPPFSIELTITENKQNEKLIVSPEFVIDVDKNSELLKNTINVFLELFKECRIVYGDLSNIIIPKLIRLNWDILPAGEYPWEKRYEQIKPFIEKAKSGNRAVITHRLEKINSYGADFVATGLNGFSGYLIYGFTKKKLFIFESTLVNNATYVFEKDWEGISKLTKKDILDNKLQKDRIVHRVDTWNSKIEKLLK